MSPAIGQAAIGIYAVLMALGGVLGFVKAKSRPSLIGGIAGTILSLLCLAITLEFSPRAGFIVMLVPTVLFGGLFASRFVKTRKPMPAGLMTAMSVVLLAILIAELVVGRV